MSTRITTGLTRFSYCHVYKAHAHEEGDEPKFSVSLLIPKSDKKTLAKIAAAVEAAKELGKNSKWGGKIPKKLKLPLRDGDEEKEEDEAYENMYFLNASSKTKPSLVDRDREEILVDTEIYSGVWGRASINFYPFDVSGSRGVAVGLNHLQKIKDGEPLGGVMTSAEDDFDDDWEYEEDDML